MKIIFDYLMSHKEAILLIMSIVVGIATIITSVVNVYLVKCQVDIYKEQNTFQKNQNQPIFVVSVRQQQDSDDGKYGTDILEVHNIGSKVKFCNVRSTVFFCLSKCYLTQKDTVYAEVKDYFFATFDNNIGDGLMKRQWCSGNNRIFSKGYNEAIHDSHDDIYYFYDKVVLLKIDYKDIFNESHILYYKGDIQISEEQYCHYFEAASATWGANFFVLRNDIYNELKKKVDDGKPSKKDSK